MTIADAKLLQDIMTPEELAIISHNPKELVIANRVFASEISILAYTLRTIAHELDDCARSPRPLHCLGYIHTLQAQLHNIAFDETKYKDCIRAAIEKEKNE